MGTPEQELYPPRVLLRACVLLLLLERPGHGYDLIERLKPLGFEKVDRSVYRALDWLDQERYVRSSWDTPEAGPARRVFEITPAGKQRLEAWIADMGELANLLGQYVARHEAAVRVASTSSRTKRRPSR